MGEDCGKVRIIPVRTWFSLLLISQTLRLCLQLAMLFLAVFLAAMVGVNAIIPEPCANMDDLTARKCCPTPDYLDPNAGPCGAHLKVPRGSCEPIAIPESEYNSTETDVRKKWPIQYFNTTCFCNERFGGVDCGECSFGYNDNTTECRKTTYPRLPVSALTPSDWEVYREALKSIKESPSRYWVAREVFSDDPQVVMDSLVKPTTYDLFIWLHHFVAKDNDATLSKFRLRWRSSMVAHLLQCNLF